MDKGSRWDKRLFRLKFYARHGVGALLPRRFFVAQRKQILRTLSDYSPADQAELRQRARYLNGLAAPFQLPSEQQKTLRRMTLKGHNSSYFLDFVHVMKYFPRDWPFAYQFGDVTTVPAVPTFVKSRPIQADNGNSVLLKLDSVRHFYIPPDRAKFADKKPLLVWRGAAHQPHRQQFLAQFHDHPRCDVGCVHEKSKNTPYHRGFLTLAEQRQFQFILSLEGNDVATNLKWILASDSLCFMRRPRFETWFGEGMLVPNVHYVLLEDDYSNLDAQLSFYAAHPEAAQQIIRQANRYVRQFFDPKRELLVSLLVIERYFKQMGLA